MEHKWFFFIDIVGSSNPRISSEEQIKKIKKLIEIITDYLKNNQAVYKSFTGDGMLIVFPYPENAIDLATLIHYRKKEYCKSVSMENTLDGSLSSDLELKVRIGIGAGIPHYFNDGVHTELAPWGINLVITKRIMDLANDDQILISDSAFQVMRDLPLYTNYKSNIQEKGDVFIKNHEEGEKVYSLYKKDEFGNNLSLDSKLDISKILTNMGVNGKLKKPLLKFCEKRAENTIHSLKGIMSDSGLELTNVSTDLLYEVLFESADKYIAASFLPPGEFWNAHNCGNPYNLLNYHAELIKRAKVRGINDKRYRFLILPKSKLVEDKTDNIGSAEKFIRWHKNHHVNLYLVDPKEYSNLFSTRTTLETDTGIGLCYNLCMLQFGQLEEYKNDKYKNQPVVKRKFWLSDLKSESYQEGLSLFEDLIVLAEDNQLTKVDQEYYNSL